jgi:hypothetical protein
VYEPGTEEDHEGPGENAGERDSCERAEKYAIRNKVNIVSLAVRTQRLYVADELSGSASEQGTASAELTG